MNSRVELFFHFVLLPKPLNFNEFAFRCIFEFFFHYFIFIESHLLQTTNEIQNPIN